MPVLPLVETLLNVGLGLWWARATGRVEAVLLANVVSMAAVPLWVQPCMVYRHVFHRSPAGYFARYFLYAGLTALGMAAAWWLCAALPPMNGVLMLACRAVISVTVSATVCLLPFCRTTEFRYLLGLAGSFFKRSR